MQTQAWMLKTCFLAEVVFFIPLAPIHCDGAPYAAGQLEIFHGPILAYLEASEGLSSNKQPISMHCINL